MKKVSNALNDPPEGHPYYDEENAHADMDTIMADLLRQLGYVEGVSIFDCTDQWYS